MTTDVNDAINHPVSLAADVGAHVERSGSLPVKQSTSCGSEFFNAPPRASSDKWLAKPDHGLGTSPTLQPPTMESQNITDDKATRPGPLRRRSETQPTNVSFLISPLSSPKISISSLEISHIQMCLYLPYLHFDTYKVLVKRRALVKQRLKQGRSRPVPQEVAKLDSEEFQVLWQYMGHDPPINIRRTLDQFGYPSLLDTRARDEDQMLSYRQSKIGQGKTELYENLEEEDYDEIDENSEDHGAQSDTVIASDDDVLDGNVLMVDQLWLWIIDSGFAVTFFPRRAGLKTDGRLYQQADLRNSILNEVNADLTSRCENPYDLAALIALHAVTILLERTSHPDMEVFRTFEEAISILTEKMTTSFKSFRARRFQDKAEDNDDLRTSSIRAKHQLEGKIAEKQNRDNTSALLELRDIEDELNTLKTLFTSQMSEIKKTSTGLWDTTAIQSRLLTSDCAKQVCHDIHGLHSYLHNFFTGLLGMNVQEWGGDNFLPLRTIGVIAIPTSFALITLALIVAWSTRIRLLFNSIGKTLIHLYKIILEYSKKSFNKVLGTNKTSIKKSKIRGLRQRKKKRKLKKERTWSKVKDCDSWENHKERREKDYKMPSQNRKSGFGMRSGIGGD
ncbi:hypothetical protein EYC84_005349 [Monilinia fructicola]|uniref:Uncharacterized protein n=1 Tax=Monilinia fructicola TaxID=38448 RepID=A0A5M9JZ59_MONFR|nr:hypothetical protein EYC84_005349 [Monilinia fructicola]